MFDKEYFDTHIDKQLHELCGATVEIHLHNGAVFSLNVIDETFDGHVLLTVFPIPNTKDSRASRRHSGSGEILYDRVALAYESIAYVHLTREETTDVLEIEQRGPLGFHRKSPRNQE